MERKIIGIIGGGQLGRMLIQSGINYPLDFYIYSDHYNFSSQNLCKKYKIGDLNNYQNIIEFGRECDIITIEIENVNTYALKYLRDTCKKIVYPQPEILDMIKDRSKQKQFLVECASKNSCIKTMNYTLDYQSDGNQYPVVNKLITGGYDGYGTRILYSSYDEPFKEPSIFEEFCDMDKELSVTFGCNKKGEYVIYPPVEMVFNENHMLRYLICPADISCEIMEKINEIAYTLMIELNITGIMSVELFLKNGEIYINEMAPRPHNSAHHTQDMFNYSQFDILIRCLLNMPINQIRKNREYAACINILGNNITGNAYYDLQELHLDDIYPHIYDKHYIKPSRKMGHVNILADSREELVNKIEYVEPIIMKSVTPYMENLSLKKIEPLVGIIMGSESDYDKMRQASHILEEFGVPYEIKIVSAHRTPELMIQYGKTAYDRGLKVIIAGAGGAAHLPGMIAATTSLPVIGVPIKSSNSLDGWDSILSILQMPLGVPVATMALDQTFNAGILAMKILGMNYEIDVYRKRLEDKVQLMNENIRKKN